MLWWSHIFSWHYLLKQTNDMSVAKISVLVFGDLYNYPWPLLLFGQKLLGLKYMVPLIWYVRWKIPIGLLIQNQEISIPFESIEIVESVAVICHLEPRFSCQSYWCPSFLITNVVCFLFPYFLIVKDIYLWGRDKVGVHATLPKSHFVGVY